MTWYCLPLNAGPVEVMRNFRWWVANTCFLLNAESRVGAVVRVEILEKAEKVTDGGGGISASWGGDSDVNCLDKVIWAPL